MKKITIKSDLAGNRIDKFLAKEFFSYTRSEIIKEIKNNEVLVNGKKVKPRYVLKEKDKIEIKFTANRKKENKLISNSKLKIKIIKDNKDFLVIDKPAGIQVHPDAHEKKNTVANWLIAKYPGIKNVHDGSRDAELRPGIMHRLDKDTSGIMVIAKNQKTFGALKKLFQTRKVKKTYLAIVQGRFDKKEGVIEKSIAKAADYKKQVIASQKTKTKIRLAVTEYKVIKEFNDYSLVEAYPKTGRTHQIRIHLWSVGHPIVGDQIYKSKKLAGGEVSARRQMLHAKEIAFALGKRKYSFSSPLPADFREILKQP